MSWILKTHVERLPVPEDRIVELGRDLLLKVVVRDGKPPYTEVTKGFDPKLLSGSVLFDHKFVGKTYLFYYAYREEVDASYSGDLPVYSDEIPTPESELRDALLSMR